MLNPSDPNFIIQSSVIATKPIVILCNGPQIDRLQAKFWERLNKIQAQAESEVLVVGVNRIGIAEACLKHNYKPDVMATVDAPRFRYRTKEDDTAEGLARAAMRRDEEKRMAGLKKLDPGMYETWAATRQQRDDLEAQKAKAQQIPDDTTNAFARSMATVAGVSTRIVSQQAVWYLQPNRIPEKDRVLNLDTSTVGPPDRARMLFTTADWITNWFARLGCREFYFYGMSMKDGRHCKCKDFADPDDYSWADTQRWKNCFAAWNHLRDSFPGMHLYNCDRHSLFVEKGEQEFKTPPQLDDNYKLLPDDECIAKRDAIMRYAASAVAPALQEQMKRAKEDAAIAKLRAQMEQDRARASA